MARGIEFFNGQKRPIRVDTLGLPLAVAITPASVQDVERTFS